MEKKTNFASYKETMMPFDANDYYDETGIWETMLNGDGTLFSYAKKDSIGKYVFISWNNKKQTESEFPSVKKVKQKFINGYPSVVPKVHPFVKTKFSKN